MLQPSVTALEACLHAHWGKGCRLNVLQGLKLSVQTELAQGCRRMMKRMLGFVAQVHTGCSDQDET